MTDNPQHDPLANTLADSPQPDFVGRSITTDPVQGDSISNTTNSTPMSETPPIAVVARRAPDADVVVIPRHTFNYLIIGATCLILGVVMGVIGYAQFSDARTTSTNTVINAAIGTAVAALPLNLAPTPRPTLDPRIRYGIDEGGNPAIGPDDAPITMIEFGDFNCQYCKRFNDETLAPLLAAYEGQVRFVFRDYPILGDASVQAALAAECADDQGQFWAFHDQIYANPRNLIRTAFLSYATELELDVETFTTCLDDQIHGEEVQGDYTAGTSLNVFNGTPTFFINGKILIGAQPYAAFQQIIDAELAIANGTATDEAVPDATLEITPAAGV